MLAQDIITNALLLTGAIAAGETPTATELADGLYALNDLIDGWQVEDLMIPTQARVRLTVVPNQNAYWLGTLTTGLPTINEMVIQPGLVDLDGMQTVRPTRILQATCIDTSVTPPGAAALNVHTLAEFDQLNPRNPPALLPTTVFYGPYYPNGLLILYPTPTSATLWLSLVVDQLLQSFATVTDTVFFPPGYARALRYNLAVELATQFGKPLPQQVAEIAVAAKQRIQDRNLNPQRLKSEMYKARLERRLLR
jgi:hypothetical protein